MNKSIVGGYISAKETIAAAAKNNQTVTEYVESLWQEQGVSAQVVADFQKFAALNLSTKRICEIGTGTGMFVESIRKVNPDCYYESYELDKEWAEWLARTFNVVSHPTPGDRLDSTPSDSIDLIHANGVFVYTPFIVTFRYFCEIFRVTKRGGYAVFDILSERCFDGELLKAWLMSEHLYPCILPLEYVKKFFYVNAFDYKGDFFKKFGEGKSHYLVFRKR